MSALPPWLSLTPVEREFRRQVAELNSRIGRREKVDVVAVNEAETVLRVLELQSRVESSLSKWSIVLLALAALILGLPLLWPVSTIEVEGTVRASAVRVIVPKSRTLDMDQPVVALHASGFTGLSGLGGVPRQLPARAVSASPLPGGTVTLQQITMPPGAAVSLTYDSRGRATLSIQSSGAGGIVHVSRHGPDLVVVQQDTIKETSPMKRPIVLEFGAQSFNLAFVPVDTAVELLSGLEVDSLSFDQVHNLVEGERSAVTVSSTIAGGELVLPSLPSATVQLRPREVLQVGAKHLRLHRVRFDSGTVIVDFRARASRLRTGGEDHQRDLKPTKLEQLAANQTLNLARTAYVALVLMIAAVLEWARRR